ncbi:hypothetical protein [Tepidibacter hydrothermalis]|uniref:Uncharacterized protein n=1 Tax=Tepidibacter hydrothermalis TaxID=3036126 RepID=A0ABY8ECM5_9FIRM|nr:hypothetical protein [Tepidibacter hydrothermalis]WFD09655.1 hypothetical protein P4S50_14855 [Tepidibacter hydrothermalis]
MKKVNTDPYKISDYKQNKSLEENKTDNLEKILIDISKELKEIKHSLKNN